MEMQFYMIRQTDKERIEVLLIEDNPAHAELIKRGLENANPNLKLIHLTDGEQALDFFFRRNNFQHLSETVQPAVVLLDIRLPKLSGLEVLRAIRSSENVKSVPIVILTSSAAERDLEAAYKAHVNSYLVKPLDLHTFMNLMEDISKYWLSWNYTFSN